MLPKNLTKNKAETIKKSPTGQAPNYLKLIYLHSKKKKMNLHYTFTHVTCFFFLLRQDVPEINSIKENRIIRNSHM